MTYPAAQPYQPLTGPYAPGYAAAAATPHPQTPDPAPDGKGSGAPQYSSGAARTWPWLIAGLQNITQTWGQNGETGVDLGLPLDTPITSLTTGRVRGMGYYGGGGVVAVGSYVMGRMRSVYYQHLDLIAPGLTVGSVVSPGKVIGWSGGQLSGGHHPSTPQFSSGPHLEVGLDAPYGGMWAPLGANVDPLPWLEAIAQGNPGIGSVAAGVGNQLGGHVPGFAGIASALDQAAQFPSFQLLNPIGSVVAGLQAFAIRAVCVIIGLGLVLLFAANVLKAASRAAAPDIQAAGNVAAVAALA